MEIEDKKILATDFMWWQIRYYAQEGATIWEKGETENPIGFLDDWNPDTNLKQFCEVINKMTVVQCFQVGKELDFTAPPFKLEDHMPEVIEAVMEVIKE